MKASGDGLPLNARSARLKSARSVLPGTMIIPAWSRPTENHSTASGPKSRALLVKRIRPSLEAKSNTLSSLVPFGNACWIGSTSIFSCCPISTSPVHTCSSSKMRNVTRSDPLNGPIGRAKDVDSGQPTQLLVHLPPSRLRFQPGAHSSRRGPHR